MKILVLENNLNGHRLEYLHHLHEVAAIMATDEFVFVLPSEFEQKKILFEWPLLSNVKYDFSIVATDTGAGKGGGLLGMIKKSLLSSKRLAFYVRKHNADRVFVITIINYVPCLHYALPKGVKVSGILYTIHLDSKTLLQKFTNWMKYHVMSVSSSFGKVLVLNSREGSNRLNQRHSTDKYVYIPDPFTPIPSDNLIDIRKEYNIPSDKTLFVHFGGLQKRKGTIDIINSISSLSPEECDQYVFFFAGKVYQDIDVEFHESISELKHKANIICKEEFCSFEFLASICTAADAILMPYHATSQSSGLLGYASQFHVPVVAPASGLIGKIVSDYKLGIVIEDTEPASLQAAYSVIRNNEVTSPTSEYCETNSIQSFVDVIVKSIYI